MRRWLIATFALHFFLSIGLFAFGQIDVDIPAEHTSHAAAVHLDPAAAAHDGDLLGDAPDHGLTDAQPELPEQMQLDVVVLAPVQHLSTPTAPLIRAISPLALDGLRRPPRA